MASATTKKTTPTGMPQNMVARIRGLLDEMDSMKHRTNDYHTELYNEAKDTLSGILEAYQIMTGEAWEIVCADSGTTVIYYVRQCGGTGLILPAVFDLITPA